MRSGGCQHPLNYLAFQNITKNIQSITKIPMSMPSNNVPFQNICFVCEDPSPHIFYCYLIFKRSHYLRNQHFRTRTHQIRIKNFSSWRCKIFLKLFCQQWSFSHQSRCCVRVSFLIGFFNNKDGDWLPICSKISLFIPASLFLPDHRSFLFPPSFLSRSCHYSSSSFIWVFTRNVFFLRTEKVEFCFSKFLKYVTVFITTL